MKNPKINAYHFNSWYEFISRHTPLKSFKTFDRLLGQVPVIGFNSGRYDLNVIRNDLFDTIGHVERAIRANSSYMCISTKKYKLLDNTKFLGAGTSYEKFLGAYLGKCKCPVPIECDCRLAKGNFPYEYIDSYERLFETELPPREAFHSKLKNVGISDDKYARMQWVWRRYGMTNLFDLLRWYNDLDVEPFVDAICIQRDVYKEYGLDLFIDAVSLPGIAEKVLYQHAYKNIQKLPMQSGAPFEFSKKRFLGYEVQDDKASREFGLTMNHIQFLLEKQHYSCRHCSYKLDVENASADRVDNSIGHVDGNIVMSCIECNVARKDMNMKRFRYKKMLDFNSNRLIYSIDESNKEIYHKLKGNICGGPSIIFKRYVEAGITRIRNGDKMCEFVAGFDCNAEYLYAIGEDVPCGKLEMLEPYNAMMDEIRNKSLFGFAEVDIHTPNELKSHFADLPPIFKNVEIDPENKALIGDNMYNYNQSRGLFKLKKSRKLISSYFAEKKVIYTPLLNWYIDHGLVVTKIHSFIKAQPFNVFKFFRDDVCEGRRVADGDKSKKIIGDIKKTVGNSVFGKSCEDKTRHQEIKYYSSDTKICQVIEENNFLDMQELNSGYEIVFAKKSIKLNNPIHVASAIFDYAKMVMLRLYYDCIDKYFDRRDFELTEMDTDSFYLAWSDRDPFTNLVKPERRAEFETDKQNWFPRTDTLKHARFDHRTAGLFKFEWTGLGVVSLASKNYICFNPIGVNSDNEVNVIKHSAKGVQKDKTPQIMNPEAFKSVIELQCPLEAHNVGFRICNKTNGVITYEQKKTGLSFYYDKRRVLEDGIHTVPLDL